MILASFCSLHKGDKGAVQGVILRMSLAWRYSELRESARGVASTMDTWTLYKGKHSKKQELTNSTSPYTERKKERKEKIPH